MGASGRVSTPLLLISQRIIDAAVVFLGGPRGKPERAIVTGARHCPLGASANERAAPPHDHSS